MLDGVNIDTAQNVTIRYELASLGDRILAYLIDVLILIGYAFFVTEVLFDGYVGESTFLRVMLAIPFVFYFFFSELAMNGQSLGKKAMKIKVLKTDGSPAGFFNYFMRWMLWPIDSFYGLGLLILLINGRGQRLGDLASGTTVVKVKLPATLRDTIYRNLEATYQPAFPEVLRLSDEHIRLISEVLHHQEKVAYSNEELLAATVSKVKTIAGIETNLEDHALLLTVMKDYNYLTQRMR